MGLIITLVVLAAVLVCGGPGLALFAYGMRAGLFTSKSAAAGPAATAIAETTPTQANNIIYQAPLTSVAVGWLDDTHCSFQSDGYHIKGYICYAPIGDLSKLDVSVQVKQIGGENHWFYGLVFRRVSLGNLYEFSITSNGYWEAAMQVNGHETELIPYVRSSAVKIGLNVTNTLELRAIGSHFEFFVNSVEVGHVDDSTFLAGKVGVDSNVNGKVEVVYTNITIGIPQ